MTGPVPNSSDLDRFAGRLRARLNKGDVPFDDLRGGISREGRGDLIAALEELSIAEQELREQYNTLVDAQRVLQRERDRYSTLFQSAPDPYVVTDNAGGIEEVNGAASVLFGVPGSLLAKRSLADSLDEAGRNDFQARLDGLIRSGRTDKWLLALQSRDGRIIPVEATVSVGPEREGKESLFWLLRDTSVRLRTEESMHALNRTLNARVAQRTRELELALEGEQSARKEAEAANRIKTELFARLSHEFRTPLHAVSGYLEILQQNIHGGLTVEQRRDVERIHQAQEHLMTLVNMILDFAKLEGGPIELSMAEIPIEETLRGAEALVAPQFAKKSITYTHRPGDSSLTAFADREKVQQILLNLLANAMKFTPAGGAVDLDWRVEDDTLLIRVRDTGSGIPEDKTEQVFEPFVQLRAPGSIPSGGTGLGLAISRDLARAMGGDVHLRSTVGLGSTFTVLLPIRKHAAAGKLSTPSAAG